MNEKIKELYEECSNRVYAKTDGYGNDHYKRVTNYEKFAELIIKECAGVELYWLSEQDRKSVAQKLKEHFGVE